MEDTEIRIYGIPLENVHDKSLGPILEGNENYPFYGVLYCGFKTSMNEVRQPTPRLFYFKKADVKETGKVEDYQVDDQVAYYFDIDLRTEIFEKQFEKVEIGTEITAKPRIFASQYMVSPQGGVDISTIQNMTREELEQIVTHQIEGRTRTRAGGGGSQPALEPCTKLVQTYSDTRYDPIVKQDAWGGDCKSD